MRTLSPGDVDAFVTFAQERLLALGFGPLEPSGSFDGRTQRAVLALQRDLLLDATGIIDDETWDALLAAALEPVAAVAFAEEEGSEPAIWPLEPGDAGADILVLQDWLGLLDHAVPATGAFDDDTAEALCAFQDAHQLPTSGVFDEDTALVLLRELGLRYPEGQHLEPALDDAPTSFGPDGDHRDVQGTGGYVYRQFEDGTLCIVVAPHGRGEGATFSSGPAWEAITTEIGAYEEHAIDSGDEGAVLQRGMRGAEVSDVQERLNELGFGPLSTDGIFGRGTADAISRFQRAAGLDVDGRVDTETHQALSETRAPIGPQSDAQDIRRCQEALQGLGYQPRGIDGIFGPGCEAAVRKFQGDRGLPVTGRIDEKTWGTLLSSQSVAVPSALVQQQQADLVQQVRQAAQGSPSAVLTVLEGAIAWLGKREIPKGSNGGPDIDIISGGYFSPADERKHGKPPWCALACSHWIKEGLGVSSWKDVPMGQRYGAAFQYEDWAREQGRWTTGAAAAPVGSVFVMSRSSSGSDQSSNKRAGHVGLVLRDLGDKVLTIEGNVSDRVKSNTRAKRSLRGYVTWY